MGPEDGETLCFPVFRACHDVPGKKPFFSPVSARNFCLQIIKVTLFDHETDSWNVTVKPIRKSLAGKKEMRFRNGFAVSVGFGR